MKETAYDRIVKTIRARHTWITVLQADRERWNKDAATADDISEIINRASYGFIRLELSDL